MTERRARVRRRAGAIALWLLGLGMLPATGSAGETPACAAPAAADHYFPDGALARGKVDDYRGWYSEQLTAMAEPSLSCEPPQRAFRFVWLRTFHHPLAVRVVEADGQSTLFAVELDGAGGYAPGAVFRRAQRPLSAEDAARVREALDAMDFWRLPATLPSSGLDGAQWVFERRDGARYHVVDRWSPDAGPLRELGTRLLALTGWSFAPESIY